MYERAWLVGNKWFGRAKRTLGKLCFDKGRYEECKLHLTEALAMQSMVSHAWYTKGLACMRTEDWEEALQSFTRCCQQDEEIGEAWVNIGAIHMSLKDYNKALIALQEALKLKLRNWRILENMMIVTLELGKYNETVMHMSTLVDLKYDSDRPVHIDELQKVSILVATKVPVAHVEDAVVSEGDKSSQSVRPAENLSFVAKSLGKLLNKIVNVVKSDPKVWEVFAVFQQILHEEGHTTTPGEHGDYQDRLQDCRLRQFRALVLEPNWEKDLNKCAEIVRVARGLLDCHKFNYDKNSLYKIESIIVSS